MNKMFKDRFALNDDREFVKMPNIQSHGLWAKTKIMASHDDIEYDSNGIASFVKKIPTGISSLGETIFRSEKTSPIWEASNMVPLGGCQFAMEQLFGVKAEQFDIPSLYNLDPDSNSYNMGLPDSSATTTSYDVPGGKKLVVHEPGNIVQLFGIGITGTAENDLTVYPVDYRENSININRVTTDGLTLHGTMVPFRYTMSELSDVEKLQYFGKKTDSVTGETAYYLKKFDNEPVIKHIWKTGEDIETESLVSSSDVWTSNIGVNAVESFTECVLRITKKDVKEWFTSIGQEDRARFNTIALFTAQYVPNTDGTIGDYRNIRLFSKLNIPVEYVSLTKDLNLIYRVYTA